MPTDQILALRRCIPSGTIDVVNVAPGDVLTRTLTFRVNNPIDAQSLLDNGWTGGTVDVEQIARGDDAEIVDSTDGTPLADTNTWTLTATPGNSDFQPPRSRLVYGVMTSYTLELSLTSVVVTDRFLDRLLRYLRGETVRFDFLLTVYARRAA
jgi:hypothetical protein